MADAFDALGLEPQMDLSDETIRRAYLTRAAAAHPDAGGNETESAALNDARGILADPEKRANELLARLGGPGPDDKTLPGGFLMEILEVRERIEAAIATGDPEQRALCEREAEDRRRTHRERVTDLFDQSGDAETLKAVRVELNAWRYAERLIEQLDPDYDPARADFA